MLHNKPSPKGSRQKPRRSSNYPAAKLQRQFKNVQSPPIRNLTHETSTHSLPATRLVCFIDYAMLLDPLTALSVAGTVVQFVDYATRLVSKGQQIYRSVDGALLENLELQTVTEDLFKLSNRLNTSVHQGVSSKQLSLDEQALESLAIACRDIAQELLEHLERLKVKGETRKLKSFYKALKSVWNKADLDDLVERLSRYREELEVHLLVSIKFVTCLTL